MKKCTWFEDNDIEIEEHGPCPYGNKFYWKNKRCIFHYPKDKRFTEESEVNSNFFSSFDEIINNPIVYIWESIDPDYYEKKEYVDLSGFIFPKGFSLNMYLKEISLLKYPIMLSNAQINAVLLSALPLREVNLFSSNSEHSTFNYAQIQGAIFVYANLNRASFYETFAQGSMFIEAKINSADLDYSHLQGSDFTEAQITRSNLNAVQLSGCNFQGSCLDNSNLSYADLSPDEHYKPKKEWPIEVKKKMTSGLKAASLRNCSLINTKFKNAFLRNVNLSGCNATNTNFELADLKDAIFIDTLIANTNFTNAFLSNTNFRDVKFGRWKIAGKKKAEKLNIKPGVCYWDNKWHNLKSTWLKIKIWLHDNLWRKICTNILKYKVKHDTSKPQLPVFKGSNIEASDWSDNREAQREFIYAEYVRQFRDKHPVISFFWRLFADYGRSLKRWAAWSLIFALIFGGIFLWMGQDAFEIPHLGGGGHWLWAFYYSIVTFTTLGFGDVVPTCDGAAIAVAIEVILGYIMLGGLISIFAVKIARRN